MTEEHVVLWTVIVVATVADIVLTLTGLAAGAREGNVVVRVLMAELGLAGLWLVKFLAMLWLVAGWWLLSEWKATIFLALFGIVTLLVVANNVIVLL